MELAAAEESENELRWTKGWKSREGIKKKKGGKEDEEALETDTRWAPTTDGGMESLPSFSSLFASLK